jgi:hypothetical protein
MPNWLKGVLATIVAILGAGLWGGIAGAMGAPDMLITVGAIVIALAIGIRVLGGTSN